MQALLIMEEVAQFAVGSAATYGGVAAAKTGAAYALPTIMSATGTVISGSMECHLCLLAPFSFSCLRLSSSVPLCLCASVPLCLGASVLFIVHNVMVGVGTIHGATTAIVASFAAAPVAVPIVIIGGLITKCLF